MKIIYKNLWNSNNFCFLEKILNMKKIHILLLSIILSMSAFSQNITSCTSYNEYGVPSGIYSEWDIKPTGGYIYLVYNQDKYITDGNWTLQVSIDRNNSGSYTEINNVAITPVSSQTWFMYDYFFAEAGKYKISAIKNGNIVASTYFQVFVNETMDNTSDGEIDTYYYEGTSIITCESLDANNEPVGESTTFSLGSLGSKEIRIYLDSDVPIKTTKLYIDIYTYVDDKETLEDTYSVDVQEDWDWVSVKQVFTKPGEYIIDIYTANDIYVNTGYLTITR